MTFAPPKAENRLKTQLSVLLGLGFEVHTLGLGSDILKGVTKHFELPVNSGLRGFAKNAIVHLTKKPADRFQVLRFPQKIIHDLNHFTYDLVVTHDLELLPAITDPRIAPSAFLSSVRQVDLHELHDFTSPASGLLGAMWRILRHRLRPYQEWLFSQLGSSKIDLVTVVNQSIGEWYVRNGYIKHFAEIRNAAPYLDLDFEHRTEQGIRYLYHGKFARKRGLENLVHASLAMKNSDSMNFMLTGNTRDIEDFKSYATSINPKINFHPAVPMGKVCLEISKFDVEIIYFEPVTQNLLYTLPNKFFEAVQGRLAIISGPSPELVRHINNLKNGISFDSWGTDNLARVILELDREQVELMRINSHEASLVLNSKSEGKILAKIWTRRIESLSSSQP
jgi:glycosyltransferase involved in cell wall biosynthesis